MRRITNGSFPSSSPLRTLRTASSTTSSFRGHVRYRSAGLSDLGQWGLPPRSSTLSTMHTASVSPFPPKRPEISSPGASDRVIRPLCLHREPVLHHLHSRRRCPCRERGRRCASQPDHQGSPGRNAVEGMYRHPPPSRIHLPDRLERGELGATYS